MLDGLRPHAGEKDLRGIEFHLLNSLPDTSGDQIIHRGLSGRLANISFSPDGRFLAGVENESNTVVVLDVESGDILKRFSGHQDRVRQVEWKSNGTQLISCDNQESIRVWDVEREVELNSFRAGGCFALSPDESRVLVGKRNGLVQILATDTGEVLQVFEGHVGPAHDVAWSIDGRLASCGQDGTVRLWDPETQKSDLLTESDRSASSLDLSQVQSRREPAGSLHSPAWQWVGRHLGHGEPRSKYEFACDQRDARL